MLRYIIMRVLVSIPVLFAASALVFIIIQLPPGDFNTPCEQNYIECPD
jgi:peptide/nickel transport system permease protein